MLLGAGAGGVDKADYPDTWPYDGLGLRLSYQFEPGTAADGVTVQLPLPVLNQVGPDGFDWQIPGLRGELVTALLRSLPKAVRRNFVPVPDYAAALLDGLPSTPDGPLTTALADGLRRLTGVVVNPRDFDPTKVPDHLRVTFRVTGDDGAAVAEGKDLAAIRRQLAPKAREAVAELTEDVERDGLRAWTPGTLARVVQRRRAGHQVTAYPALVDQTDSVAVRVFDTEVEQARAMWTGTRRLLLLEVPTPVPVLSRRLSNPTKLGLTRYPYGSVPDLLEDCVSAAVDAVITRHGGPTFDDAAYARLREAARAELPDTTATVVTVVEKAVAAAHEVRSTLGLVYPPALQPSIEDMRAQLFALIRPGFVTATGPGHLDDLPRYLRGIGRRLERLPANPARDRDWMGQVREVQAEYDDLLAALPPSSRGAPEVREIRWMIEELRISLFAQDLRTPYPVSAKRIYKAIDAL
jgi:ATP-dependent helicase HrpA